MYAITFDLDTGELQKQYPQPPQWQTAYQDIRKVLEAQGFNRQQGSVYFASSDQKVDAVRCVMAVQLLAKTYPWFSGCVRDIRMLRIEELNDLMPAITSI